MFTFHNYNSYWTILSHNLNFKVDFLFQSLLVINVIYTFRNCGKSVNSLKHQSRFNEQTKQLMGIMIFI